MKPTIEKLRHKVHGELGSTIAAFALIAIIKLLSSVILTRLLKPEDYGVVIILISVLFTIELLSDLGFNLLVIREDHKENEIFLNTLWTARLVRSILNAALLYVSAPYIADLLDKPTIVSELRLGCIYLLMSGAESISIPLLIRHQQSRRINQMEMISTVLSTLCTFVLTYMLRSHWGLLIGVIIQRGIGAALSHWYVDIHPRPRLAFHKTTLVKLGTLSKVTLPSGLMTLGMTQADKYILSTVTNIGNIGIYGIGQNIAGMAESLSGKITSSILNPRFAQIIRSSNVTDRATACYKATFKPSALALAIPTLTALLGPALVLLIYDSRYHEATGVVLALGVRSLLAGYTNIGINLLVNAGYNRALGIPSALRCIALLIGATLGNEYFGMRGILLAIALEPTVAMIYVKLLQRRVGLLLYKEELRLWIFPISITLILSPVALLTFKYSA
jgi:lipopolysaccharide exporter